MSIWLYQFWFFAFKTAKDWGYFPLDLSADDLGFQKNQELGYSVALSANSTPDGIKSPSNICHWSEHILDYDEYVGDFEAPPEETPYEQLLRDSLETSNFSSYVTSQLPLEICHLARTIERSPNELLEESLGFAIMACNYDLTAATLEKVEEREIDISGVYPYHLAVTYLDGSNECCRILDHIAWSLSSTKFSMQKCFVNDMGHTVLDSLMATILRSHTSVPPLVLDSAWRGESRFSGEAIDICGRWQADSTCYRSLLSAGRTLVPLSWKHKFCHTSAQAISHCLLVIGNNTGSWGLSRPSGLFVKYCMHCGKRLTLSPLHTLIMVAFHLAQSALEGEDLFGVIACLLQILSRLNVSESPSPEAEASVNRLLDLEAPFCDHMPMSPLQLAEKLRSSQDNGWSEKVNIGWKIMCHILQQAQDEFEIRPWEKGLQAYYKLADEDKLVGFDITPVDVESNKAEGYEYHDWCPDAEGLFGNNKYLGHVRAAVQTELLTYRRSRDTDPWLSSYTDMDALLRCLDSRSPISIPLIDSGLMSPHCSCGQFLGDCGWPTKFHVMREGATFSNMDLPSSRGLVIPYPPSTESFLTRGVLEVTPEYRESDIDLEGDAENDKDSNFRA
jgi:hypothetical protein